MAFNSSDVMQENTAGSFVASSMSYGQVAERNLLLGWNLEYRPLNAREYKGYIACQETEESSSAIEQVAFKSQCAGEYLGEEIVILFASCPPGEGIYAQGVDICEHSVLLLNRSCELHVKVADDSEIGQLYINPEVFARSWENLAPEVDPFQFDSHGFLGVPAGSMQSLLQETASLVHGENTDKLEQREVISNLLALLALQATPCEQDRFARMGPHARMRSLARARDYIEENFRQPISLSEVCLNAGVSISTLLRIFKEFYDISPLDYIKVRRLQECRRLLQLADPNEDSVSGTLQASGLGAHGRSSGDYRQFYGESPKQTLGYRSRKP
jgi:AraC-like DNA-binding protein